MMRSMICSVALLCFVSAARAQEEPAPDAALEEDEDRVHFSPGLELLASYRLQVRDESVDGRETFHSFVLDRALAWLDVDYGPVTGRLMLEAVPGSDEGALLAVAGDSIVMRVREAWAAYDVRGWVDIHAGIVRTLTQPLVEGLERLRPIGRGPHERFNLLFPADVGATAVLHLPADYGRIGVGVYNGESYRSRERNRGKNTEYLLELHPLAAIPAAEPLTLFASYVLGSEGAGSARADRLTGGLAWAAPWLRAGADVTYARGLLADGSRRGLLLHAYVSLRLQDRWLLGVRGVRFLRDLDDGADAVTGFEATAGAVVYGPLEVYAAVGRDALGDTALAALPGMDAWQFEVVVRLNALSGSRSPATGTP